MPSYLQKALGIIFVLTALVAIPSLLHVQRSLPCTGQVIEVKESQHREQDGDGTSSVVSTYSYEIQFRNPATGATETKFLTDIGGDKGQSVSLLYDPSDRSIDLNKPTHLYKSPLICFIVLSVLWTIVAVAVLS